jgi:hypothetical protein
MNIVEINLSKMASWSGFLLIVGYSILIAYLDDPIII